MPTSRTPRRAKPPRSVVVVATIPDADDPRNGYEREYVNFNAEPGSGKEIRRFAVVEYIGVDYKGEFADGGREVVRIRANRARFPDSDAGQQELSELLDRLQADQHHGQRTIEGMDSPEDMRAIEAGRQDDGRHPDRRLESVQPADSATE